MKTVQVDKKKCIGCGTCTFLAPDIFKLDKNGKSVVKKQPSSLIEIKEAINDCPAKAISYKNKKK